MDLTTTFIGLGLVVLSALPFIYFYYAGQAKTKAFIADFMALARQQSATISQYEVWGYYTALGIDARTNQLFYYRKREGREKKSLINLSEVEKCRVVISKKALNEDQVIDRIELALSLRNGRQADETLLFYSREDSMSLSDELMLVEKWKVLISAQLDSRRKLAAAS
ncbi:hypothetical protein [Cesiribacter andamanensis]|uniref:Uncharacterized protein n=1 Tax=Cesiribacter andamanensis AMV16 TaxID=1279009 RepID=M7NRR1_9BACT|nr:hypothetical protein [Cesiribacter andamanensis]EMR04380.1 hypothetical protein ADICEAN_00414 [Cesiribacter andamanensis AMV16]